MPSALFKRLGIEVRPITKPVESLICVMKSKTDCGGQVKNFGFYDEQVPVCERHVEDHNIIRVLIENHGYGAEEILTMNSAERKALYYRCVL